MGVFVVAMVAILALSALFAQADQAGRLANHGSRLALVDDALAGTAAARTAAAVALLVGQAEVRGYATSEQVSAAAEDIEAATAAVARRLGRLDVPDPADRLVVAGEAFGAAVVSGDEESAAQAGVEFERVLSIVDSRLVEARQDTLDRMAAESGAAGRLVRITSIAVAFLVPALALLMFRWLQRRRSRQVALELQLQYAQEREKVKDQMIASLSHELRTPLTGILGMAVTMRDAGFDDAELAHELNGLVIGEASNLARMVDDLLVTAKADSGDLGFDIQPTDVGAEVELAVANVGVPVRVACRGVADADRLRLRHLVGNLVSNAIRHGGPDIAVDGQVHGSTYRLVVSDDGDGVSDPSKLFERYQHDGEAATVTGSIGLGLAVARILARGMDGDVRYERIEGRTAFVVELPAPVEAPDPWRDEESVSLLG